ncbi:MAG: VTT domain-containing protein [Candidatus Pristimantibacillus lignocellulolyticus]|uniref:VTT domain-containing protein n=1 Tax=Candidatus Pristimantibacillus lignocellulolyticus TaxID=2994561 RepID=A0A9J6ZFJ3_9BACL|nr:MAG: VTT domain-containing protein [Candidatus Pristimantibacillus lignocellulolyticus]
MDAFLKFLESFGPLGLAIHSFLDAVIFPIPAFFTQVSLSMAHPQSALWLATIGFIACLLGTPVGYLIGRFFGAAILQRLLKPEWIEKATHYFTTRGSSAILIGAFTPIPFKVFTILSGVMKYPLWQLMAYAVVGRAVKFYVVGVLFYMYGKAAESMVSNVSLYIFLIAVPIIVIFILIRKQLQKKKALKASALQENSNQTIES